jgi:hypothetical protein
MFSSSIPVGPRPSQFDSPLYVSVTSDLLFMVFLRLSFERPRKKKFLVFILERADITSRLYYYI